MSSPEKVHTIYCKVKRLTKTAIFSQKLDHFIYSLFFNISFLEIIFKLILRLLFLKPQTLPHSVSWSNTLIKIEFSKQGPHLDIINLIELFLAIIPVL